MTIQEITALLTAAGLQYEEKDGGILTGFRTERFINQHQEKHVLLKIRLIEDGKYFRLFAPLAFNASGPHVDAALRACMIAQWRTKLVQFEYDESDGEIRPVVEIPLEDGKLTQAQLERCIRGLAGLVDDLYPTLKRAADEGVIEFLQDRPPDVVREIEALDTVISSVLSKSPVDQTLLRALRDRRRALLDRGLSEPPTSV